MYCGLAWFQANCGWGLTLKLKYTLEWLYSLTA